MPEAGKRPCAICRPWFRPDGRVGSRQHACGNPECQTSRRQKTQAGWRRRNPGYAIAWRIERRAAQTPSPPEPLRMPSWRKSQQGVGNGLTNDFPLQPAFVPFIEQTARYLGGSERHGGARPVDAYLDVNMTQWLTAGATRRSSVRFGAEPVRCDLDTVIAADVQGAEIDR